MTIFLERHFTQGYKKKIMKFRIISFFYEIVKNDFNLIWIISISWLATWRYILIKLKKKNNQNNQHNDLFFLLNLWVHQTSMLNFY